MADSRFEQWKKYFWKKMESKTVQNISSVASGIAAGSTVYYIAGFMVSGALLWVITGISSAACAGYTKWKLHNMHEMRQQVQLIMPLSVALEETREDVTVLQKKDRTHDFKQDNQFVSLGRQRQAIELLAKAATPRTRKRVEDVLNPPEDDEKDLEGLTIERILASDRKSSERQQPAAKTIWIHEQKIFSRPSVQDVIVDMPMDVRAEEEAALLRNDPLSPRG